MISVERTNYTAEQSIALSRLFYVSKTLFVVDRNLRVREGKPYTLYTPDEKFSPQRLDVNPKLASVLYNIRRRMVNDLVNLGMEHEAFNIVSTYAIPLDEEEL